MMAQKTTKPKPISRDKIIMTDPKEVRKWCLKLKVSPAELKHAVGEAGAEAAKVERFLLARKTSRGLR